MDKNAETLELLAEDIRMFRKLGIIGPRWHRTVDGHVWVVGERGYYRQDGGGFMAFEHLDWILDLPKGSLQRRFSEIHLVPGV